MYLSSDLSKKSVLPLVLLLLWTLLSDHGDCLKFDFPTFLEGHETLFIKRNSNIVLNAIQVTPDVSAASISNLAGRIWYNKPLKLWRNNGKGDGSRALASFNTTFVLNITPRTVPGGEGLAFILTGGNHDLPENSHGQWLGIVNSTVDGDPRNEIVAVEFDTRKSFVQDIDSNHVGLDVNSIYSVDQVSLDSYGVNLSKAVDITARVQYDGDKKILSVFVQGSNDAKKNPVLSVPIDLSVHLPKNIFVGFSASTSNATELNCVKSWVFDGTDMDDKPSLILWVLILAGGGAVVVFICGLVWYNRSRDDETDENLGTIENQIEGGMGPKKLRLRELRKATGNFSWKNKLGQGGFGTVYRGRLANHVEVAVKRTTKKVQQGKKEFLAEVLTIGSLHHKNLVKLIGWCYEGRELLIVYDYMPNGSLDKLIYGSGTQPGSVLNRERRFSIIRGIAEAVEYLHHGCEKRVLHRDIKASNVMLDSEFNARLGDFGLARRIQRREETHHSTVEIAGTPGYMAPESFLTGRATVEMDVYSFGVLVMTIVCGRQPGGYDDMEDNNIVYWVWELHRRGSILSAVDSRLLVEDFRNEEEEEDEMMRSLLLLGLACCHPNPTKRPSMRMVLQILEGEAPPPLVPTEKPAFVWPTATSSSLKGNVDLSSSVADGQLTPITELVGR